MACAQDVGIKGSTRNVTARTKARLRSTRSVSSAFATPDTVSFGQNGRFSSAEIPLPGSTIRRRRFESSGMRHTFAPQGRERDRG